MTNIPNVFHLQFTPEHWSRLERLRSLLGEPLPTTRDCYEALDACIGHLRKYQVFERIAARIVPNLPKDREELEHRGGSRNIHSEEFGALIEAMICELYASLDGLRQFLCVVFPKTQGMQKKSNEKLFKRAKEQAYGADFPEPMRVALAAAYDDWFPKLRDLRTEISHGTVGSFHLDARSNNVTYFNQGLGSPHRAFVLKDVVTVVRGYEAQVRSLLENVAGFFLPQLVPVPRMYPCGFYLGRIYIRMVAPSLEVDFNSGHCASWDWFEKEPGHFCPLAKQCGAYDRKWPGGSAAVVGTH
ncbi:MAG: hypothetical protein NT105_20340 [Verrucomicrobia bacterium]|nr:hypothetical protein [Verrucomicrobiota bacterium]